jgi:hypothetical protein
MATTKRIAVTWTQEDIDNLVKLYLEGIPLEALAERVGKSYGATKAKITVLRKSGVDLPYRDQKLIQSTRRKTLNLGEKKKSPFDREYQGAVPFGHWMITKPWRKVS